VIEGWDAGSRDNSAAVRTDAGVDRDQVLVSTPFTVPPVRAHAPRDAYEAVLVHAGAVLPARDAVDRRIVNDVRQGTGRIVDSQEDVGGWPELRSTDPPADADRDGLPDDWERAHNLGPANPTDGRRAAAGGYTNLEIYLNELADSAWPAAYRAAAGKTFAP
jgi:hypothetical protein